MKLFITSLILCCLSANAFCQESNPEKVFPSGYNQKSIESTGESFSSVRAFVNSTLAAPIPAEFAIPKYIEISKNLQEASKEVGSRYPEFFGREGNQLLTAISKNPGRFTSLIQETKAIRMFFATSSSK
jgi:hypothetical protein